MAERPFSISPSVPTETALMTRVEASLRLFLIYGTASESPCSGFKHLYLFQKFFILAVAGALFLFNATRVGGGDAADFFGYSSFFLFGVAGMTLLVVIYRRIFSKR